MEEEVAEPLEQFNIGYIPRDMKKRFQAQMAMFNSFLCELGYDKVTQTFMMGRALEITFPTVIKFLTSTLSYADAKKEVEKEILKEEARKKIEKWIEKTMPQLRKILEDAASTYLEQAYGP